MEGIYQRDSDRDGLTDAQDLALGTNPLSADSDGFYYLCVRPALSGDGLPESTRRKTQGTASEAGSGLEFIVLLASASELA